MTDEHRDDREDAWPAHSLTFLEMAFRTDRQKSLPQPSGTGHNVGACRDRIRIELSIRDGVIQAVAYALEGCLNTNACANALAEMVEGHTVATAWAVKPEMLVKFLQSLPPDHFHCAELVVGAFYKALADYQKKGAKDWKTAYRPSQ